LHRSGNNRGVNASTISKAIKATGLPKSELYRGRVSELRSEGYKVSKDGNTIVVSYLPYSTITNEASREAFRIRRFHAIEKMFIELSSCGYDATLDWPTITINA